MLLEDHPVPMEVQLQVTIKGLTRGGLKDELRGLPEHRLIDSLVKWG